jgi:hypothetical protein
MHEGPEFHNVTFRRCFMTRNWFLALTAVAVLGAGVGVARAQDKTESLTAQGVVKSVAPGFFVVDTGKGDLTFKVNGETHILAKGATTATKARRAAGEDGLIISDVVHEGDQVTVRYARSGGSFVASEIQVRNRRPLSAQPVK